MTNELLTQSGLAYDDMVEDILSSIDSGRLKPGQRIPSEAKLKDQYGISVTSIKRGLSELVDKGILHRRRGSGTFVANRQVANTPTLVRRDTIAVVRNWEYWRYHPFFTEQQQGITAGLTKHGWKVIDLQRDDMTAPASGNDTTYRNMSPAKVKMELEQLPEVAGVICVQGAEETAQAISGNGHAVVSTGPCETTPFVTYDWDAETERLFHIALAKGLRKLAVVTSMSEARTTGMFENALRAAGLTNSDVTLDCIICANAHQTSKLTHDAYELTLDAFDRDNNYDGLIITADYEALGATDALARLGQDTWQDLTIIAHLNKETRLHSRIPMTALISDGFAFGMALADLMHDQIHSDGSSMHSMIMTCNQIDIR